MHRIKIVGLAFLGVLAMSSIAAGAASASKVLDLETTGGVVLPGTYPYELRFGTLQFKLEDGAEAGRIIECGGENPLEGVELTNGLRADELHLTQPYSGHLRGLFGGTDNWCERIVNTKTIPAVESLVYVEVMGTDWVVTLGANGKASVKGKPALAISTVTIRKLSPPVESLVTCEYTAKLKPTEAIGGQLAVKLAGSLKLDKGSPAGCTTKHIAIIDQGPASAYASVPPEPNYFYPVEAWAR